MLGRWLLEFWLLEFWLLGLWLVGVGVVDEGLDPLLLVCGGVGGAGAVDRMFPGDGAAGVQCWPPAATGFHPVMCPTQQDAVVKGGGAAVFDLDDMINVGPGVGPVTAGETAVSVAEGDGFADPDRPDPGGGANV